MPIDASALSNSPKCLNTLTLNRQSRCTKEERQTLSGGDQFPVFYEHPFVVGITYWGYIVDQTWRTGAGLKHDNGDERPALTWLMDYLDQ
jgi:GH35 family endo-1,4-beta-xylanase